MRSKSGPYPNGGEIHWNGQTIDVPDEREGFPRGRRPRKFRRCKLPPVPTGPWQWIGEGMVELNKAVPLACAPSSRLFAAGTTNVHGLWYNMFHPSHAPSRGYSVLPWNDPHPVNGWDYFLIGAKMSP